MFEKIIETLVKEKQQLDRIGTFYHYAQLSFAYNSNKIEGSTLTAEQTQLLFDENALYPQDNRINYFDIIEMKNHFKLFDFVLDTYLEPLSQDYIKKIHKILKSNAKDEELGYPVGEYKNKANIIISSDGHTKTSSVKDVSKNIQTLLNDFSTLESKTIDNIIDFHVQFERIHPFQDGNGRVGRIIMFKQCLENEIMPFIIEDRFKGNYLKGLKSWNSEKGYLLDTCLFAQDIFQERFQNYLNIMEGDNHDNK